MKTIYGYIGILIAVCLLQACESDLDKAYYSDGQAQPAVLEASFQKIATHKLQVSFAVYFSEFTEYYYGNGKRPAFRRSPKIIFRRQSL